MKPAVENEVRGVRFVAERSRSRPSPKEWFFVYLSRFWYCIAAHGLSCGLWGVGGLPAKRLSSTAELDRPAENFAKISANGESVC
jgi:hypothetical protein